MQCETNHGGGDGYESQRERRRRTTSGRGMGGGSGRLEADLQESVAHETVENVALSLIHI
eukprot:1725230-Pyramimonas_sp.AAC.1